MKFAFFKIKFYWNGFIVNHTKINTKKKKIVRFSDSFELIDSLKIKFENIKLLISLCA